MTTQIICMTAFFKIICQENARISKIGIHQFMTKDFGVGGGEGLVFIIKLKINFIFRALFEIVLINQQIKNAINLRPITAINFHF